MRNPNKQRLQFRQGDVFLELVAEIPANAKPMKPENGRVVLAHGEATGHAHAITDVEHVTMLEVDNDIRYLDVQMEAYLRHEEHATVTLAPGKYRVVRQREYTPEEIRNVAD